MRVAFIVQRCGVEVNGGAEALCLQIAQRMGRYWETEVLTTCALDYMRWDNFYSAGLQKVGQTTIRRFPADRPRDVESFNRLSAELQPRQGRLSLAEEEKWMRAQGPMSTPLLEFLAASQGDYDAFIFFGYLYATTYFGLPLVQKKAFLAPLGHDEWPIYFEMWNQFFQRPAGFVFSTESERDFLRRRFADLRLPGPVIGVGIEPPIEVNPRGFRTRYRLDEPYLLYVGRIDAAKGCQEMFDYFIRFKADNETPIKLILIGQEILPIPFHEDIIHLGFVSDEEKWEAMAGCDWLLMPSPYESLSMVLLEAWSVGRPAIVNAGCDVLVEHCRAAKAGLWHETYEEWLAILTSIDRPTKGRLGEEGQRYVRKNYSWERVEKDYLRILSGNQDHVHTD